MSTSWGNVINITDSPENMFGKIMSLKDDFIIKYFKVCTNVSEDKIKEFEEKINSKKLNPRDAKIELAKEIIKIYHSEKEANKAEKNFIKTFKEGGVPDNVLEVSKTKGDRLDEILLSEKIITSKNEWRRLIEQNGLTIVETGEKISDQNYLIKETNTYRVGKKRFIKINI